MPNKRKKIPLADLWFRLFVCISFLVALTLSFIISFATKGKFDLTAFLITFFVSLVVLAAGYIVLSIPSVKGRIGEFRVNSQLKNLVKSHGGNLFHDVIVSSEEGKTSQIDHIYVCHNGIFVIETKNYGGRIYGKDGDKEWTQVLLYSHQKRKLYNPVKQNWTRIYRLRDYFGEKADIKNIIVFVRGTIQYIDSESVYALPDLKHLLEDYPKEVLSDDEIKAYSSRIQTLIDNPAKSSKEHVAEIKKTQKEIKEGICPRCGGQLVLRESKTTGHKFYGCSNYPKCKFTKKAE
ncbi:MAG: NERD domain-containing protein [Bacilli bacterium]|nr:NERD domain-containing protein [Bacilli bacterium]